MANDSFLIRYVRHMEKKDQEEIKKQKLNILRVENKQAPYVRGLFLKYFFNNMGLVLKVYTTPIRAKKVPTATTAKKAFIAMINIDR